jgi:hypothetical protein
MTHSNEVSRHTNCIDRLQKILQRSTIVPRKKHLEGVGPKEQRMYEHIVKEAKDDHRYGKRAEEVAARTVMKHHREEHHKKGK